jgi:hypothetical protein
MLRAVTQSPSLGRMHSGMWSASLDAESNCFLDGTDVCLSLGDDVRHTAHTIQWVTGEAAFHFRNSETRASLWDSLGAPGTEGEFSTGMRFRFSS